MKKEVLKIEVDDYTGFIESSFSSIDNKNIKLVIVELDLLKSQLLKILSNTYIKVSKTEKKS